jgi:hypothetical protein
MLRLISLFVVVLSVVPVCAEEFMDDFKTLSSERWTVDFPSPYGLAEVRTEELRLQSGALIRTKKDYGPANVYLNWAWADHAGTTEGADALTVILRDSGEKKMHVAVHAGTGKCTVTSVQGGKERELATGTLPTRDNNLYAIDVNHWQRIRIVDVGDSIKMYVYPLDADDPPAEPVVTAEYDAKNFPPGKIGVTNRRQEPDGPTQESFVSRIKIKY